VSTAPFWVRSMIRLDGADRSSDRTVSWVPLWVSMTWCRLSKVSPRPDDSYSYRESHIPLSGPWPAAGAGACGRAMAASRSRPYRSSANPRLAAGWPMAHSMARRYGPRGAVTIPLSRRWTYRLLHALGRPIRRPASRMARARSSWLMRRLSLAARRVVFGTVTAYPSARLAAASCTQYDAGMTPI